MGNIGGVEEGERGRGRPRASWTDNIKVWIENMKYEDLIGKENISGDQLADLPRGDANHHMVMMICHPDHPGRCWQGQINSINSLGGSVTAIQSTPCK